MSRTTKQIGSPEGGACSDPAAFSNPKQDYRCNDGHDVRPATDPQFTQTNGGNSADGNVKNSAGPRVGDISGVVGAIHTVVVEPRSNLENYGK